MVPLRLWLEFGWEFIVFLEFCVEQFCCLCLNTCNFAVQGVQNPLPWRDLTLRKYQCHSTLADPACTPGRLKLITWDLAYFTWSNHYAEQTQNMTQWWSPTLPNAQQHRNTFCMCLCANMQFHMVMLRESMNCIYTCILCAPEYTHTHSNTTTNSPSCVKQRS